MTGEQQGILQELARGRGRHASHAVRHRGAMVRVYRNGRLDAAWRLELVTACVDAGWLAYLAEERRYRITPTGRLALEGAKRGN